MHFPRALSPLLPLLAVAGCVAAPEPAPPPPPAAVAPSAPPPPAPADWQDRPPTPGGWRYGREPGGSVATFAASTVTLMCRSPGREVVLSAAGLAGRPATVRTTSITRRLVPAADGTIMLAARDPLLDAMAFSRGRFTLEVAGGPSLVLPAQAEIGRVVEDCRG